MRYLMTIMVLISVISPFFVGAEESDSPVVMDGGSFKLKQNQIIKFLEDNYPGTVLDTSVRYSWSMPPKKDSEYWRVVDFIIERIGYKYSVSCFLVVNVARDYMQTLNCEASPGVVVLNGDGKLSNYTRSQK